MAGFMNPAQADRAAWHLWCHETGRFAGLTARQEWEAMPEAERADWTRRMLAAQADYAAMTPEQQDAANRSALARLLDINDRAARAGGDDDA